MFLSFSNVIQVAIQGWTQYEQVVGGGGGRGVLPKMTILYVEYLNSCVSPILQNTAVNFYTLNA